MRVMSDERGEAKRERGEERERERERETTASSSSSVATAATTMAAAFFSAGTSRVLSAGHAHRLSVKLVES